MELELSPRQSNGGKVTRSSAGWRLEVPAGPAGAYRLAQIDDYGRLPRKAFHHFPPLTITLRARVSEPSLPGTWGFGLWNDPFGSSIGFGSNAARLPTLPQAAWFFHASAPNWLALREGVPGNGFFAGTFRSGFKDAGRRKESAQERSFLRRLANRLIQQDGVAIDVDVTKWHAYSIGWLRECCAFQVDGKEVLRTGFSPHPPLGLVIWIDNQFAAWTPEGKLGYGTLKNPAGWLEIESLANQ